MRNSVRLNALLNISPQIETIADIGCDHALLTIKFIKSAKAKKGIASDISEKSIKKAVFYLEQENFKNSVSLRVGDGLSVLKEGEADLIAICGLGGDLISNIIRGNIKIAKSADYLLISPHTSVAALRKCLNEAGFKILNEDLVKDGRWIYQLMLYVPGYEETYSENELEFGRINIKKGGPYLKQLIKKRIHEMQKMGQTANGSTSKRAVSAYKTSVKRLGELKELLKKYETM
ncbi:MAG: class I SAM-dependent methyltransferase [Eubacteriales bacterium]